MSRWYYLVSCFFILDTMQALGFIDRLVYGLYSPGSNLVTQSLNLLLIAASLILFGYRYGQSKRRFAAGSALAFSAVGFLWLSALWSLSPATTSRVAVIYLYVMIGVVGIARTLDADEFMHLLSWCCFLSAIASLLLALASPVLAIWQDDFFGIFPHKNVLGQVMATGALASLHGIRVSRRRYLGKLCMLFVFVGMAYASKSTAALLVSLVFCGISAFDTLWRKGGARRVTGVILAVFLGPVVVVAVASPDAFLEMIGKDPTLTGRTELWAFVIENISMKPWLGWGYAAFWSQSNPAAVKISDAMGFVVPQAHNGLLEFVLNVGILGTALFAFVLVRNMVLAVRCLRTPARALGISTITCCVGVLLEGVSETVLLAPTQSLTPILFITGLMCERALWVAKKQRYRLTDRQSGRLTLSAPTSGRAVMFAAVDRPSS